MALTKSSRSTTQTFISDYFDYAEISTAIDNQELLTAEKNKICRNEKTKSVSPIMELLSENIKKNSACSSKQAQSGYEPLLANLGSALPSITTIQRLVTSCKQIREGEFQFDELSGHWKGFDSPRFVNQS